MNKNKSRKYVTEELRLPTETIEYVNRVAKLCRKSPNTVINVLLAVGVDKALGGKPIVL